LVFGVRPQGLRDHADYASLTTPSFLTPCRELTHNVVCAFETSGDYR